MWPTIGGMSCPYDSGQSGTASPAWWLLTCAPAKMTSTAKHATSALKRRRAAEGGAGHAIAPGDAAAPGAMELAPFMGRRGAGAPRAASLLEGVREGAVAVLDGHLALGRAEDFLPDLDGVLAVGQARGVDRVAAVRAGHREVRVIHHEAEGAHPRVHVALDVDGLLGLLELRGTRGVLVRHGEVELLVQLRLAVDVVQGRV